MIIGVDSP